MDFAELFKGSDLAHGHSVPTGKTSHEGKKETDSWTEKGPPGVKDWEDHLNGNKCLGLPPINSKSMVRWGAIDVDNYDLDIKELCKTAASLPVVVCRSKSGGPHLFLFSKDWIPAKDMIHTLESIAAHLGFGTSEIFPKQTAVAVQEGATDWGNWINLPYFGGDQSLRYALNESGEAIQSVEEFVKFAESRIVGTDSIDIKEPEELFPDGPPCLNRIWESEEQDFRNISLANAAVYLKMADPENWKTRLDEVNRKLKSPLGSKEVENTKKSYEKKDYRYQCDKEPLCRFCNSSLCRKRRFGVGGKGALPVHRSLTKINTVPPIWCLDVQTSNGNLRRITMETGDLQDPRRYQKRCMEILDDVPPVLKKDDWDRVLRVLFRHVNYVDVPYEMSPEGQFMETLSEFLQDNLSNEGDRSFEDLIRGMPYKDGVNYYFRMKDLKRFLQTERFDTLKPNEITAILREKLKGVVDFKLITGKGTRFWAVPVSHIEESEPGPQTVPQIETDPF